MSPTPTFWTALAGKLVLDMTSGLLKAAAGAVRRRLSSPEAEKALRAAVQEALETSLSDLPMSAELKDHYEELLRRCFIQEAVLEELAQLIDPRPGCEINFEALARDMEKEIDPEYVVDLDLQQFLRSFASAFYSAAGSKDELRANLQLKVLGEILVRSGVTAGASLRTADAAEAVAMEVKQIRGLLQRFLEAAAPAQEFLEAAGRVQGFLPAFQSYELIATGLLQAGYALGIDAAGHVEIEVDPNRPKTLPSAGIEALQRVVSGFREQILGQAPGPEELRALEERFRQHVVRWFESLTFQGLMRSPKPIVLPLEDVYVELRAVAEVPEAADAFSIEERLLLLEVDEANLTGRRELMRQFDTIRRERWSRILPERKSIGEALLQRDNRAFIILGDPGSGKTTLLHFLALVYARGREIAAGRLGIDSVEADRLPIFVPLAAYDDMLRERPGLTLLEFLPRYYDRRRGLPGLEPLFREALESGRALVLLDGLDEVLDSSTRRHVSEQAAVFLNAWTPRGVRFAISSRFVGYREAPLPGNVPTLSVLDFGQPEIELFARRWAQAYERWAAGEETPEMLMQAQALQRDLLDDVRSNESVRRLAANPLMITMLALLRRQIGKLPQLRVQLYESYLGTLLDHWIELRTVGERQDSSGRKLDRFKLENLLIPFALWLHRTRPSGTAGRAEVQRELTAICLRDAGISPGEASLLQQRSAEERAVSFLRDMRQMTGLIIERGHDAIGFLHLTFQEYFAGRALALLSANARWEAVRPYLHDPRWHEPLLLCAGRLGVVENRREEVTDLIHRILNYEDATEEYLHRNLLLALAVAGDDVNLGPGLISDMVKRAVRSLCKTSIPSCAATLSGALGQLVANGTARVEECFEPVLNSADLGFLKPIVIDTLERFSAVPMIREMLLTKLGEENDQELIYSIVKALKRQIRLNADVSEGVIAKLKANDYTNRATVLRALVGSVDINEELRENAIAGLKDKSSEVRSASVSALSGLLMDREIQKLVGARFKIEYDLMVQITILNALSNVVWEGEEARQVFLDVFEKEGFLRLFALRAMSGKIATDEEVRQRVEACLTDSESLIRNEAARALTSILGEREDLRKRLIEGVGEQSEDFGLAALRSLVPWASSDDSVAAVVVGACEESEWRIRQVVAEAVAENIHQAEYLRIVYSIMGDLRTRESESLVSESLLKLTLLGQGSKRSRRFLLDALKNSSALIRRSALRIMAENLDTEEFRRGLLENLSDESLILMAESRFFSDFVQTDEEARRKVSGRLEDESPLTRAAALLLLSGCLGASEEIRIGVLERLKDKHPYVRQHALRALSAYAGEHEEVRLSALASLNDKDPNVRESAVVALSGWMGADGEIRQSVLGRLKDEDVTVRRSALKALSGYVGTNEEILQSILEMLKDKNAAVREMTVQALWGYLGTANEIRQSVLGRLKDKNASVRGATLQALSGYVGTDDEIRQSVLGRLKDENASVRGAALEALTNYVSSDDKIRQSVLKGLGDEDVSVRRAATKALSRYTGTDEEIRRGVMQGLNDQSGYVRSQSIKAIAGLFDTDATVRASIIYRFREDEPLVRLAGLEAILQAHSETWQQNGLIQDLQAWLSMNFVRFYPYTSPTELKTRLAAAFGNLASDNPEIRDYLLDLLREPGWPARLGGVLAILSWPGGPPEDALDRVFDALEDRRGLESYPARLTAASFLINRNEYEKEAVDLCLEALNYGTQPWEYIEDSIEVRKQAALVLGKLEPLGQNPRAYDNLIQVLQNDESPEVRDAAYGALVRLAQARERAAVIVD
jgi:HEAT repeat protein